MLNNDLITKQKQDLAKEVKDLIVIIGGRKKAAELCSHLSQGDLILSMNRIANIINGRAHKMVMEQYVQELRLIANQITDIKL